MYFIAAKLATLTFEILYNVFLTNTTKFVKKIVI